MRAQFSWHVTAWILWVSCGVASGQGLGRDDRSKLADLPGFAAPAGQAPPSAVDLSPLLPPVGNQTMNDCAAWAFGYAARTYQEAVDQGWSTRNNPTRIFSPTFIYNQVNGGKDEGSNPMHVLKLLQSHGVATLSRAPYLPGDFTSQPNSWAVLEAQSFPIAGYRMLRNSEDIKAALAGGEVVVAGIRTNPLFFAIRKEVYDADTHARGEAQRRPGQPHGYHAIVICGYDDSRRAFKFMNSWGTDWGNQGFCWISYDVCSRFNQTQMDAGFMEFAVVMIDKQQKLAYSNGMYSPTHEETLAIRSWSTGASFDAQLGKVVYRFTARLQSPQGAQYNVNRVVWSYPDGEQTRQVIAEKAVLSNFWFNGQSVTPRFMLNAKVVTAQGNELQLSSELDMTNVAAHNATVRRVYQHGGLDPKSGKRFWYYAIIPEMSRTDWHALQGIAWRSWRGNVQHTLATYKHDGGDAPAFSSVNGAYFSGMWLDPIATPMDIQFTYSDGSHLDLQIEPEPFPQAPPENIHFQYASRPVGREGNSYWYACTMRLLYNWGLNDSVKHVTFYLDGLDPVHARQVREYGRAWHELTIYTHRPFTVWPVIDFNKELPEYGHSTITGTQIVDPGPEARPAQSGDCYLDVSERYVGLVADVPTWQYLCRVGMLAGNDLIQSVTWELPQDAVQVANAPDDPDHCTRFNHRPAQMQVTAHLQLADGNTVMLKRSLIPPPPFNDAITLLPDTDVREASLMGDAAEGFVDVRPIGPLARLRLLRGFRSFYDQPWGGLGEMQTQAQLLTPVELLRASVPAVKDRPVSGELLYADGSRQYVTNLPRPAATLALQPPLQLEAREQFWDHHQGLPRWRVSLSLTGDSQFLSQVQAVQYKATAIDGALVPVTADVDPRRARLDTSEPVRLEAVITFTPDSALPPTSVSTLCLTSSPRLADKLDLVIETPYVTPVPVPVNWMEEADPPSPWVARLSGPGHLLAQVRQVVYRLTDPQSTEPRPEIITVTDQHALGVGGFAAQGQIPFGTRNFSVTVLLADGSQQVFDRLYDPMAFVEPLPSPLKHRVRYWGEIDGQAHYLIALHLDFGDQLTPFLQAEYNLKGAVRPLWSSALKSFARPAFVGDFLAAGPVRLIGVEAGVRPELRADLTINNVNGIDDLDLTPPPALTPALELVADPLENPRVHFLRVVAPESLMTQVSKVVYEIIRDGSTTTVSPLLRIGETGDRFDTRILGTRPTRIVARMSMTDPQQQPMILTWSAE